MIARIFCLIAAAPGGHQRHQPFTESRGSVHNDGKDCIRKRGGKFWDGLAIPLSTNAEPHAPAPRD